MRQCSLLTEEENVNTLTQISRLLNQIHKNTNKSAIKDSSDILLTVSQKNDYVYIRVNGDLILLLDSSKNLQHENEIIEALKKITEEEHGREYLFENPSSRTLEEDGATFRLQTLPQYIPGYHAVFRHTR